MLLTFKRNKRIKGKAENKWRRYIRGTGPDLSTKNIPAAWTGMGKAVVVQPVSHLLSAR
jgi:hypothetical protein